MDNQKRLFLYLARRDKKGMKLLSTFPYKSCPPTRVTDLGSLRLPIQLQNAIQKTIRDHGLEWEVWLEAADSYSDLSEGMRKRGYRNVSAPASPMHMMPLQSVALGKRPDPVEPQVQPQKRKGMLKRGSKTKPS